jgi:hypothetical protein
MLTKLDQNQTRHSTAGVRVIVRMFEAVMGMSPSWQWGSINTIELERGEGGTSHSESEGSILTAPKQEKYQQRSNTVI